MVWRLHARVVVRPRFTLRTFLVWVWSSLHVLNERACVFSIGALIGTKEHIWGWLVTNVPFWYFSTGWFKVVDFVNPEWLVINWERKSVFKKMIANGLGDGAIITLRGSNQRLQDRWFLTETFQCVFKTPGALQYLQDFNISFFLMRINNNAA